MAIVNNVSMNTEMHVFFKLVFLYSFEKYPEVEFLYHMVVLFLIFWETSNMLAIVAVPIFTNLL